MRGNYLARFVKGESLAVFSNGASKLSSLASSFFIIRSLSVYHFGLYHLVLAFINLVNSFTKGIFEGVIGTELRLNFQRNKLDVAKRLFCEFAVVKVCLGMFLTAVVFFGSDIVSQFYREDIGSFLKILSFVFVFDALRIVGRTFLKTIRSIKVFGLEGVNEVAKLVLIMGFVQFSQLGIKEVLLSHILSFAISVLVISAIALRKYLRFHFKVRAVPYSVITKIAKSFGGVVLFRYIFSRASKDIRPWIVRLFLNTEAVAFYSLSVDLVAMFKGFFPVNTLGFLMMDEVDNKKQFRHFYIKAMKYVLFLSLLVAGCGLIITPIAINFLFPKYNSILPLFMVMLISLPFQMTYGVNKTVLTILREYKGLAARLVSDFVLGTGLMAVLSYLFGLFGAGIEYVTIFIFRFSVLYYYLIKKHEYMKLKLKEMIRFDNYDKELIIKFFNYLRSFLGFAPKNG